MRKRSRVPSNLKSNRPDDYCVKSELSLSLKKRRLSVQRRREQSPHMPTRSFPDGQVVCQPPAARQTEAVTDAAKGRREKLRRQ